MDAIKLTTVNNEYCYIIKSAITFLLVNIDNDTTTVGVLSGKEIVVKESVKFILGID